MTDTPQSFPGPVFIGGFGRSGTHAIGPLIAADPRYHQVATEARFHAVKGGLPDLLHGRTTMEAFLENCRGTWWERGALRPQGLHKLVERDELEAALERFEGTFDDDPWEAGGRLMRDLLDPGARREGKPSWVELTGRSILYAETLLRLFPNARFIHMVRDGRAVAAGHLKKADMTDDPLEALSRWGRSVREVHRSISSVDRRFVLVVHLDDLVALDREATFARIVDFLEVEDDAPMRSWFDRRISASRAHTGQWRERMPPPEARRVDRLYRRMLRDFRREGIDWVPAPADGGLWVGPVRIPTPPRARASTP